MIMDKASRIFTLDDEQMRWKDAKINIEDTSLDVSSEDSASSQYENEPRIRVTPAQEIWNPDDVWKELQAYPNTEGLKELILSDDLENTLLKNKDIAFLLAAWAGKLDIMHALFSKGVSVNVKDKLNRTALHFASYAGHAECALFLLQNGAEIGEKTEEGSLTPLHCAAAMGHLSCVKLLIKHGANVNAGIEKKSPLHYAVQNMAVDCVKELLENKAIPNTPQVYSETPLHIAAALGNHESVELLINYGAAVNVQSGPDRMTPIHLAAEQGYNSCIKLLVEARGMANCMNRKLQTPLHLAALNQCVETVDILLKNCKFFENKNQ